MKTITYLLAITLLFFTSCKNHTFLSQRYTHYKHTKPTIEKTETGKNLATVHSKKIASHHESPALQQEQTEQSELNKEVIEETKTITGFREHTISSTLNPVKLATAAKKSIHSAKQKTAASKHGLIFGVINLALFIVITALVIAGIIFLVLLFL